MISASNSRTKSAPIRVLPDYTKKHCADHLPPGAQ
jgi:hypothetical protein